MKNICTLDCKGLCPVCGIDLNTQTCTCQKEAYDPRLAALLKWKEEKKEVEVVANPKGRNSRTKKRLRGPTGN